LLEIAANLTSVWTKASRRADIVEAARLKTHFCAYDPTCRLLSAL
jgi:hypothetical protein